MHIRGSPAPCLLGFKSRPRESPARLPTRPRERIMIDQTTNPRGTAMPANPHRLAILATALLFGLAVSTGPSFAAGDPEPRGQQPPPPSTDKQDPGKASQKKKPEKKSEQEFIDGYRAARALALDGKYEAAIAAFRALGHYDSAEVANYIGYANRKRGNCEAARIWYEKAHVARIRRERLLVPELGGFVIAELAVGI